MDNLIYVLFLCVFPPILLSLGVLDKKARLYVGFIMIGFYICFTVSGINGWILTLCDNNETYVTTTLTPITEEILKALPVLVYAFFFDDDRDKLISLGFLMGMGFAIMENLVVLLNSYYNISYFWGATRGFSAACLHGVCTALVAFGISFVRKKRKLFLAGTFSLLTVAITLHAIYNILVQSEYCKWGYVMPLCIYLAIIAYQVLPGYIARKKSLKAAAAEAAENKE